MKIAMLALISMLLVGGCAPSQSNRSGPNPYGGSSGGSAAGGSTTSGSDSRSTNNLSQDSAECERKAILAGAGGKAAAFDSCMRAKGYTPSR